MPICLALFSHGRRIEHRYLGCLLLLGVLCLQTEAQAFHIAILLLIVTLQFLPRSSRCAVVLSDGLDTSKRVHVLVVGDLPLDRTLSP
ncbi:hypothetical protein DE146DRAFT_671760 [Phaeosphaeria sp. MPI-PUGE-AT-0046c]|nr:hypothetical protein DE146DRAFT_671760 [Phaeosphaeria sp. MPI-PUGE-AT-0046c]